LFYDDAMNRVIMEAHEMASFIVISPPKPDSRSKNILFISRMLSRVMEALRSPLSARCQSYVTDTSEGATAEDIKYHTERDALSVINPCDKEIALALERERIKTLKPPVKLKF
jgi:hypothetical protein